MSDPAPTATLRGLGADPWDTAEALGVAYAEVWALQHSMSLRMVADVDTEEWVFHRRDGQFFKREPFGYLYPRPPKGTTL